jgi:hypothetical protein
VDVEEHDQADTDPDIKNEIDAAADPDQRGESRAVRRKPDEVKSRHSYERGQNCNRRRTSIFDPGVKEDPDQ